MINIKKFFHIALSSTLLISSLALSGCSTSGSGKDELNNGGLSESDLSSQREDRYGAGSIPTAEGEGIFRDVNFDYDSAKVTDAARRDAEYNAKVLRENSDVKVQLEGHCDERGTADYNMALGAERAKSVKSVLISLGVPASRLDTISYGAEVPLDSGHNETAWAKNRRVHFSAYRDMPKK